MCVSEVTGDLPLHDWNPPSYLRGVRLYLGCLQSPGPLLLGLSPHPHKGDPALSGPVGLEGIFAKPE